MKNFFYVILVALLTGTAVNAQSVNTKVGNMYVTYSDVDFTADSLEFNITRTYNSKATGKGWFGMGWASYFETRLIPVPGGGVLVKHSGLGSIEVLSPRAWNKQEIAQAIDKLGDWAFKNQDISTPEELTSYKNKLSEDEVERHKKWEAFIDENPGQEILLAAGTKLNAAYSSRQVEVVPEGYIWPYWQNQVLIFDVHGRLSKLTNKNYQITLEYPGADRYPKVIKDNKGNRLDFSFENGLVQKILATYPDGKQATALYDYDKATSTLISSTDVEGNTYKFEWDKDYYMTAIKYDNGKEGHIKYDEVTGYATEISRRDGTRTTYEYPGSGDDYGTIVTQYDSAGVQTDKVTSRFVVKRNDLGHEWDYLYQIIKNGDSTTYISSESHLDSVMLNKGQFYTFEYNKRNEMTRILKNGNPVITLASKNDHLTSFQSARHTYTTVYDAGKIVKLIAPDKTVVALPITAPENDPGGYKADIAGILPDFRFSSFCYDLNVCR